MALECAPAAHGEPLLTRNQNLLVISYGLPHPLPARLPDSDTGRVTAEFNWSNTSYHEFSDAYDFTLDGEGRELRLRLEHAIGHRWAVLVEVPWRSLSGGSLDGFVENWHDFFGLPNGSRHNMPRDRYLVEYREGERILLQEDDSSSGIADVPLGVGYQVAASERQALATWLTVKAPVGEPEELTGSGAVDVALSVTGERPLADHWQLFGQLDAVWLGQGDILAEHQESFAWAGLVGVSWNAWHRLDLTVQAYANSQIFDLPVDGLSGDAIVLSYGGSYRTTGGWRLDVGMNEDIEVGKSTDLTIYLAVRRGF